MESTAGIFVGIDVSKMWLDVAVHEQATCFRVGNDGRGIGELVQHLWEMKPALVVLGATSGFEMMMVAKLVHAGMLVVVTNPRRVRAFAHSTGCLAKTDKLDVKLLAHFAFAVRPKPRSLPSVAEERLTGLMTRSRMLTVEKNRLQTVRAEMCEEIEEHILWLKANLTKLD